ncbi:hypothetical protein HN011_009775 [Eciton burchellii]|nr:hypothetical protein HN011_009775 [Eciton burchellii]
MSNLIASRSHRVAPKRSSRHLRGGVTIDTAAFDIDITEALEIRGPGSARKSIPSPADVPRLQSTRFCLLENRERNTITASASTSQVDGTLSPSFIALAQQSCTGCACACACATCAPTNHTNLA